MNMITIPVIALRSMTVLPDMVIHFDISRKISIKAVEAAMENDEKVLLLTQTDSAVKSPTAKDLYMTGTIASVKRVIRMPNKLVRVQVEGLKKAVAADINTEGDYIYADVQECSTFIEETDKVSDKAIVIGMNELLRQYAAANPRCNKEMLNHWLAIDNARELMSSVICDFPMEYTDRQKFLEMNNILDMYEYIAGILIELTQAYSIKEEISGQDEYSETNELEEKIDKLNASDEVKDKLHKEVKRLKNLSKGSSEVNVERTYIENCLELPWNNMSEDNNDIINARKVLDNDHYGMKDIKDRIIEALAVRNITSNTDAPILCLAGPPGTGKTSIARSVAAALNKEYVRICLGGVKDEAEIRGHRKTYVGAMPGRIIEGLKKAGTANPLMLLDEIDKVSNDYKSDTASALLEVLDSEQNSHFTDHYIEMPVDLSKVLFIATANDLSTLSRPLLAKICRKAVTKLYEAGVFNADGTRNKEVKVCIRITDKNLTDYLGNIKYKTDKAYKKPQVGIVRGLAWTSVGGETLEIEVNAMPGSDDLRLTGNMGDVMKESAMIAYSYVRAITESGKYKVDMKYFDEHMLHLHIPEGAVPKDGPSAGVTMTTAMLSAVTGIPVRPDVAMTGEVTLRGRVLAIGGLKEKLLAAKLAGMKKVLVPEENVSDVEELDAEITDGLELVYVKDMSEVLNNALVL